MFNSAQTTNVAALVGSGSGPVSDILQAEIMGVTALDPDAGSPPIGINMNGALMRVRAIVLDNVTLPDPTKIIPVSIDAGFDNSSGSILAANWTRTLTPFSGALLHRQATAGGNQAVVYIEQPSGTIKALAALTVGQYADFFVTLPDFIYPASSVTVSALTGWYSTAAAGTGPAVTNSSTHGTWNPKFGWMNWPCERVESSTYQVDLWCNGHHHAMNGQAVAGVRLWASDGTNLGPVTEVVTTALGTIQTTGAISEVFPANLSLTGVNNTDGSTTNGTGVAFVDGYIYPWIGPRYQLSVDGVAWPTPQPCRVLPFIKDTAGQYGGAIAYWNSAGAGASPAVSRTAAANFTAALVQAYATEALARAAINTFNSNTAGRPAGAIIHNDSGGAQVRCLSTAVADLNYELAANVATAAGNCWYEFVSAPENPGGFRGVYNQTTLRVVQTLTRGNGMDCVKTATAGVWGCNDNLTASTKMIGWKNSKVSLNAGTSTPWLRQAGYVCLSGNNFDQGGLGSNVAAMAVEGTSGLKCIHNVGNNYGSSATALAGNVVPYFVVGCSGKLVPVDPNTTQQTTNDGFVIDNCAFNAISVTANICSGFVLTRGCYFGQSLVEYIAGQDFGVSGTVLGGVPNIDDVLVEFITNPPDVSGFAVDTGRLNGPYNDSSGSRGRNAYVQTIGYGGARRAQKSDVFSVVNDASHLTGNVGNFTCEYGVGSYGLRISISRPPSFSQSIVVQKVAGSTFSDNLGNLAFTNNLAGVGQTGFGTYSLTGGVGNSLSGAIPAGLARRRFDYFGAARRNDGTGASGMAEY